MHDFSVDTNVMLAHLKCAVEICILNGDHPPSFCKPVLRLRTGFAIQGLVLDKYVELRPRITLLYKHPHLVLVTANENIALQPSVSLPGAIYCLHSRSSVELAG